MTQHLNQNFYQDTITALKVNLRNLLRRVDELKINQPNYELNEKLRLMQLKVDKLADLVTEIEALIND